MLLLSFRMVFSKWPYLAITGAITGLFWVIFNVFDQLLFFTPIVTFYLPEDAIVGFILSSISALLMGVVVSMNVFVLKHSRNLKVSIASLLSGSTLSMISSTCAACSSMGFLLVSTFGGIGATTSAFISNYQIPLRIISIILLIWALYSVNNKLKTSCIIYKKYDMSENTNS